MTFGTQTSKIRKLNQNMEDKLKSNLHKMSRLKDILTSTLIPPSLPHIRTTNTTILWDPRHTIRIPLFSPPTRVTNMFILKMKSLHIDRKAIFHTITTNLKLSTTSRVEINQTKTTHWARSLFSWKIFLGKASAFWWCWYACVLNTITTGKVNITTDLWKKQSFMRAVRQLSPLLRMQRASMYMSVVQSKLCLLVLIQILTFVLINPGFVEQ